MKRIFSNAKYLLKLYFQYGRFPFIVFMANMLFSSTVITYIDVNMIGMVIDSFIVQTPEDEILLMILPMFLIQLLFTIWTQFVASYISEPYGIRISAGINRDIFKKVMETDFHKFDNANFYDDYTWTMERLAGLSTQMASMVVGLSSTFFQVITLVFIMLDTDFYIILFALASIVTTSFFYHLLVKLGYQKDREMLPLSRRWKYIGRIFYLKEYFFDLRMTRLSKLLFCRYDSCTEKSIGVVNQYRKKIFLLNALRMGLSILFQAGVTVYLIYRVMGNNLTIGEFSATLAAFEMLRSGIGGFADELIELKKMQLYTDKARNFMQSTNRIEREALSEPGKQYFRPYHILFKNVCFRYGADSPYVIKNLNLEAKPGQKIAIVGQNGAGKTTLVKLLLHLYDVTSGKILVDGEELDHLNLQNFRSHVGVAFQQSHVYAESIRENMLLYCQDSDSVEDGCVQQAMKKTGLSLGNDLELEMTKEFCQEGLELSGGQTQLLALSRLFIKKFNLLILDEPSSSLSPLTEYDVNKVLMDEFHDTTVVVIAHRLSTIRNVDRIYLIQDGTVAEMGDHETLMKKKGLYREMFEKQSENYKE